MGIAESHVQTYVMQRLELLERTGKVYAFRNNSFSGRVMRRNGSEGFIRNSKRGMADIIACFPPNGKMVGIEVKSATGRQSPEQKETQRIMESLGAEYWLVRSPEELEKHLQEIL